MRKGMKRKPRKAREWGKMGFGLADDWDECGEG